VGGAPQTIAAFADAAAQSVQDAHASWAPSEKTMLAEHAPSAVVCTHVS